MLACLLGLAPRDPAAAAGPPPLRHLAVRAHYGGPATAVAAIGRTALLGVGNRMLLLDTTFAEGPTRLAEVQTPGPVTDIAVRGTLAFVTFGDWHPAGRSGIHAEQSGMWVVDVAKASAPRQLGSYVVAQPGSVRHIALMNDLALLASGEGGVHIVRVADPSHPAQVATLGLPEVPVGGVLQLVPVSSRLAYAVTIRGSVWLLDISTPNRPRWVEQVPIGDAHEIVVAGRRAYTLDDFSIMAFDIGDLREPELVGGQFLRGRPTALALVGPYVYVSVDGGPLEVVDMRNEFEGLTVARADLPMAIDMAMAGDRLLLAAPDHGLSIVDIADATLPVELGAYFTAANIRRVVVDHQGAFVVDNVTGLHILDIVDPAQPRLAGLYAAPDLRDVAVVGTTAYVAAGSAGLRVVDVGDMARPREIAAFFGVDGVFRVAATDSLALLLEGTNSFTDPNVRILDVSRPGEPQDLGQLPAGKFGRIELVALQGPQAFLVANDEVRIYDLAQPAQPRALGAFFSQNSIDDIAVWGNTVYLGSQGGVETVDVTDPHNSTPGLLYPTKHTGRVVAASGGQVAVAGWRSSTHTRTIVTALNDYGSDRLAPYAQVEVASPFDSASAPSLALADGQVFVADAVQGLDILLPFDGPGLYLPWVRR
jgi:hypothetical protein